MFSRILSITFAFVGLLVGAGFATGQEAVQYFLSFGSTGLVGAVVAGLIIAVGGLVMLQLGSYFLADDHSAVFKSVTHPRVAWLLDIAVSITLFALGFVMMAGAGSTLSQQFGWPTWVGSTVMLGLVLLTGLLPIKKVTNVISMVTPLILVAVVIAFIYSMMQLPVDTAALNELARQEHSPIEPWWLSAINYTGLVMILAVSMVLVIGGTFSNTKEAGLGGVIGGITYTVALLMLCTTLFINFDTVAGTAVPTLTIFEEISPTLALVVVWIIYLMIYNTCIGMFYALGRRVSAGRGSFFPWFAGVTVAGWGISFFGFGALMTYVYPILGFMGLALTVVLVTAYLRYRPHLSAENERRIRIRSLFVRKHDPQQHFSAKHEAELEEHARESVIDDEEILAKVEDEVESENLAEGAAAEESDATGAKGN